jgi:hypothetical protein
MNRNQFFYTREITIPSLTEEGKTEKKSIVDSFNVNKIIRSIVLETGMRLVLLNDLHERNEKVEMQNKQGKVTGYKNERNVFQSEIYLSSEDSDRFVKLTNIEE